MDESAFSRNDTSRSISEMIMRWPRWVSGFCLDTSRYDSHEWADICALIERMWIGYQRVKMLPARLSRDLWLKASILARTPCVTWDGKTESCAHLVTLNIVDRFFNSLGFDERIQAEDIDPVRLHSLARVFSANEALQGLSDRQIAVQAIKSLRYSLRSDSKLVSTLKPIIGSCRYRSQVCKQTFLKADQFDLLKLERLVELERLFVDDIRCEGEATKVNEAVLPVTVEVNAEQKQAIDWLSRCPFPLEEPFASVRQLASREIAKTLSGDQLRQLVDMRKVASVCYANYVVLDCPDTRDGVDINGKVCQPGDSVTLHQKDTAVLLQRGLIIPEGEKPVRIQVVRPFLHGSRNLAVGELVEVGERTASYRIESGEAVLPEDFEGCVSGLGLVNEGGIRSEVEEAQLNEAVLPEVRLESMFRPIKPEEIHSETLPGIAAALCKLMFATCGMFDRALNHALRYLDSEQDVGQFVDRVHKFADLVGIDEQLKNWQSYVKSKIIPTINQRRASRPELFRVVATPLSSAHEAAGVHMRRRCSLAQFIGSANESLSDAESVRAAANALWTPNAHFNSEIGSLNVELMQSAIDEECAALQTPIPSKTTQKSRSRSSAGQLAEKREAAQLLLDNGKTLDEIAKVLGYANKSSVSKLLNSKR